MPPVSFTALANISGGVRSSAAVVRWLDTHQGDIVLHLIATGDTDLDNLRAGAAFRLLSVLRKKHPDRFELVQSGWRPNTLPENTATPAEVMAFSTAMLLRCARYSGVKTLVTASPAPWLKDAAKLAGVKITEDVIARPMREMLADLIMPLSDYLVCDHGRGNRCGVCPACLEITDALKPLE